MTSPTSKECFTVSAVRVKPQTLAYPVRGEILLDALYDTLLARDREKCEYDSQQRRR